MRPFYSWKNSRHGKYPRPDRRPYHVDRPVMNGSVVGRDAGRGNALYWVSLFLEREFALTEHLRLSFRGESVNLFNHANTIGRNGVYGTGATPNRTFGSTLGGVANVDPDRMFRCEARCTRFEWSCHRD